MNLVKRCIKHVRPHWNQILIEFSECVTEIILI